LCITFRDEGYFYKDGNGKAGGRVFCLAGSGDRQHRVRGQFLSKENVCALLINQIRIRIRENSLYDTSLKFEDRDLVHMDTSDSIFLIKNIFLSFKKF
jgi:hypothetical protein